MDKPPGLDQWFSPTPTLNYIRKISIYQTKNEYVMIGSNNRQTRFRILRVDRKAHTELKITDDKREYNFHEISDILNKISNHNAKIKKISAFGIVGFIRFLEGYYMILISRRRKVAKIGAHIIYKIIETTMFYIPSNLNKNNQDEIRYLKMFQNVDLSSNFYFSYSYDISHTLQYNLTPCNAYDTDLLDKNILEKFNLNTKYSCVCEKNSSKMSNSEPFLDSTEEDISKESDETKQNGFCFKCDINKEFAIRTKPNFKFVWNEYLLESANIHSDWLIYVIHGYVGQTIIKEFGKELYLTLIARRSKKFAGTRFLKRGTNQDGDVANEVESEQIVSEIEKINFNTGKFSSFVHIRGSIPSHWSQDLSKMVQPKPQISIDIVDPFSVAAGKHFNQLLSRYGSPVIVLNLVKMKEKRPHETLLTNEITRTISYLNQFIPPAFHLQYIGMDMARINKSKDKNVLQNLSLISYSTLKKVGIFQSFRTEPYSNFNLSKCEELGGLKRKDGRILQTGVVRVNCVDCLDRTNTAAYVLGKTALAFQLFSFGLIADPLNAETNLIYEKKVCKKLEELYEEHGDVLALQYGGSQLVHRIKTYRKKSHLSSQSRDFMQTISRYCSNTFSDFDKQMAINLFLGQFRAYNTLNYNHFSLVNNSALSFTTNTVNSNGSVLAYPHLFEMTTDFYLHNLNTLKRHVFNSSRLYTRWYDEKTIFCLPRASNEVFKGLNSNLQYLVRKRKRNLDKQFVEPEVIQPRFDFQLSNLSNVSNLSNISTFSATDLCNSPMSADQSLRKAHKDSIIRYTNRLYDESTDEYNEHYNCYEYTSFDSTHYFELSRLMRASEKTQYSSAGDFNPLSLLFSNMRNSLLGSVKQQAIEQDSDSKRLCSNPSVSSESSEEESAGQDYEKIQTLYNDSNDFLFSLSLDQEKARLNHLELARASYQMKNSTSDNTNLKSLANKNLINGHQNVGKLNRRFSFNGGDVQVRKSNRSKNVYGTIYSTPSKVDQKLYSEYILFGNLCGEFSNSSNQQQELNQYDEFYRLNGEEERGPRFRKNKKLHKSCTSETDLFSHSVNYVAASTNSPFTDQLSDLLNYNSIEFRNNLEITDFLKSLQNNLNEPNKEDKKLMNNYLDTFEQIKIGSKSKEDYKEYLRLIGLYN